MMMARAIVKAVTKEVRKYSTAKSKLDLIVLLMTSTKTRFHWRTPIISSFANKVEAQQHTSRVQVSRFMNSKMVLLHHVLKATIHGV